MDGARLRTLVCKDSKCEVEMAYRARDPYKMTRAVCRDEKCHEIQTAYLIDFNSAGGAKCFKCGAKLDKMSGKLKGRYVKGEYIPYPDHPSEFEVQAFIYHNLMRKDFDIRGEVTSGLRSCKFDLVVYADKKAVLLIEVKASKQGVGSKKNKKQFHARVQKQLGKYKSFSLSVIKVAGMVEAIEFCKTFALPVHLTAK